MLTNRDIHLDKVKDEDVVWGDRLKALLVEERAQNGCVVGLHWGDAGDLVQDCVVLQQRNCAVERCNTHIFKQERACRGNTNTRL